MEKHRGGKHPRAFLPIEEEEEVPPPREEKNVDKCVNGRKTIIFAIQFYFWEGKGEGEGILAIQFYSVCAFTSIPSILFWIFSIRSSRIISLISLVFCVGWVVYFAPRVNTGVEPRFWF